MGAGEGFILNKIIRNNYVRNITFACIEASIYILVICLNYVRKHIFVMIIRGYMTVVISLFIFNINNLLNCNKSTQPHTSQAES